MDCYNRCLCATCTDNDECKNGCDLCQQMKVCRFIIARGKCPSYKPDSAAVLAVALAKANNGGERNANRNSGG